jgi:leucyl aminopeptidase
MQKIQFILVLSFLLFVEPLQSQVQNRNDESIDHITNTCIGYISPDSIQSYMQALEDFGTRFTLADNRREVAVWIKNKLISFGFEYMFNGVEVRLDSFELEMEWPWGSGNIDTTWQYNVELTLFGHTYPERVYVLGAHHDAINWDNPIVNAPGADDNASGVAAVLEIARVLAKYHYIPESTIRFVTFSAEELGLIGAYHYAKNAHESETNIVMMLNSDMISNCPVEEDEWTVQLHTYPNSQYVTDLAKEIATRFTELDFVETDRYSNATDSYPFYEFGYPAIFFHENIFSPNYHSAQDLVANTNKNYAAEIIRIPLGMLIKENKYGFPVKTMDSNTLNEASKAYPNPFVKKATISFTLEKPAHVNISIFNAEGTMVEVVEHAFFQTGEHAIIWDSKDNNPGLYFCRIMTNTSEQFITLVKQH